MIMKLELYFISLCSKSFTIQPLNFLRLYNVHVKWAVQKKTFEAIFES